MMCFCHLQHEKKITLCKESCIFMVASEYTLFLGCIATHSTLTCLLLASNFVNHIMDSPDTLKTSKAFKKKSPRRRNRGNSLQLPKGVRVLLSPRNPYEEFHRLFKDIPKEEFPINDYSCALSRDILLHGRLFASQNWICFYSNIFGFETLVKLECKQIKSISRAKTAYMFPNAILLRTEKKKYLFCSFLTRDAAYKLLSAIWQESNNDSKQNSGVDDVSNNGDQDEESVVEDISEFNDEAIPVLTQKLHSPKDQVWALKQQHKAVSCPNTPLTHHSSTEEEVAHSYKEHYRSHVVEQDQRKTTTFSFLKKNGIVKFVLTVLDSLYNCGSSVSWLFKRNQCSAEVFLLFSSVFLVLLLMSTFTLMDRISKLEKRFRNTLDEFPEQYQITDQQSVEHWGNLLKEQEARFHTKTERLNQVLNVILVSVENVRTKLKLIRDELIEPSDTQKSK